VMAVLRVGQARRSISSVFRLAKNDSATALSQHYPAIRSRLCVLAG
jgi:hypothetical protein